MTKMMASVRLSPIQRQCPSIGKSYAASAAATLAPVPPASALQVKVRSALALACHAVLTYQNEDRQHHAFRRDDQRQGSEGKWIEGLDAWRLRFMALQTRIRRICSTRNAILPTNFVIASLARSVGVRRSNASCSSLATASRLNLVGCGGLPLYETRSDILTTSDRLLEGVIVPTRILVQGVARESAWSSVSVKHWLRG